jgi:hypothetical protein
MHTFFRPTAFLHAAAATDMTSILLRRWGGFCLKKKKICRAITEVFPTSSFSPTVEISNITYMNSSQTHVTVPFNRFAAFLSQLQLNK